jgi:hypothetical protein
VAEIGEAGLLDVLPIQRLVDDEFQRVADQIAK